MNGFTLGRISYISNFISDKRKVIFFHLPKTGGRTISLILNRYHDFVKLTGNKSSIPSLYNNLIEHNTILTKNKIKTYYSFAVVRNPYNRFVSTYNWWFNTKNDINVKKISFRTALKNKELCKNKYRTFYAHAHIPLSTHLYNYEYFNILKFENYKEEVTNTLKRLGINYKHLPISNVSNKPNFNYWDKENEKILYNNLKKDFENFNYKRKKL